MYRWNSTEPFPDVITSDHLAIELNTDFSSAGLTARKITALVAAWQAGAVSQDTMLDLVPRSEVLSDCRSNEEEKVLVRRTPPLAPDCTTAWILAYRLHPCNQSALDTILPPRSIRPYT